MSEQNIDKLLQELNKLKNEHESLNDRIKQLEQELKEEQYHKVEIIHEDTSTKKEVYQSTKNMQETKEPLVTKEAKPEPKKKKTEQDLEFKIGGTWLNRLGVIAVVLSIAFFLKYSFENHWIGPTGRVLLGIVAGIIMLIVGERLTKKYSAYAQGLIGGGSLAIFFSIFAGYQFYNLISPIVAYIFLVIVMVFTVFMAIRHNSLAIGILGIIGGYVIPFIIETKETSYWALFSYFILLTAGVLAVSIYKKWSTFQYLSFFFNQIILAFFWVIFNLDSFSKEIEVIQLLTFATVNFILYIGIASIYNIRKKKKSNFLDISMITLNALLFFVWSVNLLDHFFVIDFSGFYAVFLALVYVYLGRFSYRLFPQDKGQSYSLFVISFVFITIAIPLQLSGFYIGLAWFAEALGLTFMAQRLSISKIFYGSLAVLTLGFINTIIHLADLFYVEKTFMLNTPTLLMISSIITVSLIIYLIKDMKSLQYPDFTFKGLLLGILLSIIFGFITIENSHFFTLVDFNYFLSPEQLSLSALWLIYAIIMFILGLRKNQKALRYVSLGLLGIILLKAFFVDLANLATIYKILLFIIIGLSLLGISYIYQKKKDTIYGKDNA